MAFGFVPFAFPRCRLWPRRMRLSLPIDFAGLPRYACLSSLLGYRCGLPRDLSPIQPRILFRFSLPALSSLFILTATRLIPFLHSAVRRPPPPALSPYRRLPSSIPSLLSPSLWIYPNVGAPLSTSLAIPWIYAHTPTSPPPTTTQCPLQCSDPLCKLCSHLNSFSLFLSPLSSPLILLHPLSPFTLRPNRPLSMLSTPPALGCAPPENVFDPLVRGPVPVTSNEDRRFPVRVRPRTCVAQISRTPRSGSAVGRPVVAGDERVAVSQLYSSSCLRFRCVSFVPNSVLVSVICSYWNTVLRTRKHIPSPIVCMCGSGVSAGPCVRRVVLWYARGSGREIMGACCTCVRTIIHDFRSS